MTSHEHTSPYTLRSRIPRMLIFLLAVALALKIGTFVSGYFGAKLPPKPMHHKDGTGFAVQLGEGGYSYVPDEPVVSSPEQDLPLTGVTTATSIDTKRLSTSSSLPLPSATEKPISARLQRTFKTEDVVPPKLEVTKTGDTEPGLLFFGPRGNGTEYSAPMIITEDGELVWAGPRGVSTNMKLQKYHDEQHITYWEGISAATFGHGYGSVHVLNKAYQEVAKICPDLDIVTELPENEPHCSLDMHESYLAENGTMLVTAYNVTKTDLSALGGPKDAWTFDSIFYDIDIETQEVLFRWRSLDHLDQLPLNLTKYPMTKGNYTPGMTKDTAFDYFHINSIQPLADGYLVNSRHTFSVIKLDLNGEVQWRFQGEDGGDFAMDPNIAFSWQHHARAHEITSSTMRLSLFNNANSEITAGEPVPSTALDIFLDLERMQALLLKTLEDPSDTLSADAMGSYQRLGGDHILVGYGKSPVFKEFNSTEQVVYSANFAGKETDIYDIVASYRVYKYDWSAQPAADPKSIVEYSKKFNETRLYASWNGATPNIYDGWIVRASSSIYGSDTIEKTFPRTGFETEMVIPGYNRFYKVTAVLGMTYIRDSEVIYIEDPT